jgi:hypothetical protein
MRKLLLLFCFGLLTALVWGQSSTSGNITVSGSSCTATTICVTLPLSPAAGAVGISVTGTWSATLQFEGSGDNGASFVAISGFPLDSTTGASNTTSNGTWRFAVSGLTHIRVRASALVSGTAVIVINSSPTAASLNLGGGGGGGSGTVTDFTSGDLSPLFTTSVATSSSTPALTFSLTNAAANTFLGNNTGSSGAPAYVKVPLAAMATQTTNTILGNYTSGSAIPSAGAAPSGGTSGCAGSTDAVIYTTNTGWGCHQISGGSGTVTVVASGALTNTALVTGGGTTTLQTAATTATMDSSGNIVTPGTVTSGNGSGVAGGYQFGQGTAPSLGTTAFTLFAPTSIPTSFGWSIPTGENASAGVLHLGAASSHISAATVSAVALTDLAAQAADTFILNATAGSAVPTAVTLPACAADGSHALTYPAHVPTCTAITGSAAAGGADTQLQFNSATALGGITKWTSNGTTTINGIATAILDMHLASSLLLPGGLSSGLVRVTTSTGAIAGSELSGDATTSGSNAVTVTKLNGTSLAGLATGLLKNTTSTGVPSIATAADIPATTLATGTSVSLSAPAEIYVCTSTCTVTPPVPVAGYQFCVFNGDNVSTVITMAALGSSARYENTARTAYGTAGTGTLVSGGAVKDSVCIVGLDSTHYITTNFIGTWVAN